LKTRNAEEIASEILSFHTDRVLGLGLVPPVFGIAIGNGYKQFFEPLVHMQPKLQKVGFIFVLLLTRQKLRQHRFKANLRIISQTEFLLGHVQPMVRRNFKNLHHLCSYYPMDPEQQYFLSPSHCGLLAKNFSVQPEIEK